GKKPFIRQLTNLPISNPFHPENLANSDSIFLE
ncbi:MAG: hypothetical protein ACI81T_004372, partial [Bacteroidia bacterium]